MRAASRADFDAVLSLLSAEMVVHLHGQGFPPGGADRLRKCLLANCQGGKLHRCWTVLDTAKALDGVRLTSAQTTDLMILGWLVEVLNGAYLIWDDIIDGSSTRRGMPCWYRQPEVGLMSINDACYLRSVVFVLLEKHFAHHPSYGELLRIFQETALQIELGQAYELFLGSQGQGIHQFTVENYMVVIDRKTAYYTTYAPIAIPLIYLGLATPKNLQEVRRVGMPLGQYYQVRNDYLDVFGDPSETGKAGSDVKENKCTWLIVQALERCQPGQREILESCYGSQADDDVQKVVDIFRDLGLVTVFAEWEIKHLKSSMALIDSVDESEGLSKAVFSVFLSKMHGDRLRTIGVPAVHEAAVSTASSHDTPGMKKTNGLEHHPQPVLA